MVQHFDAIVIGAGGVGSAAAYYLATSGQRVLLLEQFELNHRYGSSYGYSRVIRYTYDNPVYINLMRDAYPLWFALQDEAQEQLYVKTGGLDFGFPETDTFQALKASMDEAQLDYEHLSQADIQQRYPQFTLKDGMEGLFQSEQGTSDTRNILTGKVANVLGPQVAGGIVHVAGGIHCIPAIKGGEFNPKTGVFMGDPVGHFAIDTVHVGKEYGEGAGGKLSRCFGLVEP
ncbi:MAG: FAD-dependent oxidoreductase [Cyanobacteria bacterium J06626_26]